jgi:hypothetical protein
MRTVISFASSSSQFEYSDDFDGTEYRLRFWWSERAKAWHMDVMTSDGTPIIQGVRLVVMWSLFLRHTNDSLPSGQFVCVDTQSAIEDITHQAEFGDDTRGGRVKIIYMTAEEVDAIEPSSRIQYVVSVTI